MKNTGTSITNLIPLEMGDITGAKIVEVLIRADGKVLWINVNGFCRLRICQIEKIEINDQRPKGRRK
jgi:hypothetical protein